MSKEKSLAVRIKNMKRGESFPLTTAKERQSACRAIKFLNDIGALKVEVTTREKDDGTFTVAAI